MLTLIIGKNASGKTIYLNSLLFKFKSSNIITNLLDKDYIVNTKFNEERKEVFRKLMLADKIEEVNNKFKFQNPYFEPSDEFNNLMSLLCRDRKILLLDEPDRDITYNEKNILINFLAFTYKTYDQIYIVTHDEEMLNLPKYELIAIKKINGEFIPMKVNEEDADEVID